MTVGKTGNVLTTEVYRKPTDTGLLLHYQSHVDYKEGLVKTMIDHAIKLSSTKLAFMLHKSLFQTLKYPERGIGSMYMLSQKYTQMVIIYELKVATTQKIRYLEYHFLTNIVITIIITIIIIIIIIIKIIIIIIKNCDLV